MTNFVDVTSMSEAGLESLLEIAANDWNGTPVINNTADWKAFYTVLVDFLGNDALRVLNWLPDPPRKGTCPSGVDYEELILARQGM